MIASIRPLLLWLAVATLGCSIDPLPSKRDSGAYPDGGDSRADVAPAWDAGREAAETPPELRLDQSTAIDTVPVDGPLDVPIDQFPGGPEAPLAADAAEAGHPGRLDSATLEALPSDAGARDALDTAAADAPVADAPAGKANGERCDDATACASGNCAQGYCCDFPCGGLCRSCGLEGKEGRCSLVADGYDPLSHCSERGPSTCDTDGLCDGRGACRKYVEGTVCAPQTCIGGNETPASTCDGRGTCSPGMPRACAPASCNAAGTSCLVHCSGDAECVPPNTCNDNLCGLKANGKPCAAPNQCANGICQQAVCCATACNGSCRSCALANWAGTCTNVPDGDDPLDQCADQGVGGCGRDGTCDGKGACRLYPKDTLCASAACIDGVATSSRTCDGSGHCLPGTDTQCAPFVCGTNACKKACSGSADCVPPNVCNGTDCVAPPIDAGADTGPCGADGAYCGTSCTDLRVDPNNCGECGRKCHAPLGGTVSCSGGQCVGACSGGQTLHGGSPTWGGGGCATNGPAWQRVRGPEVPVSRFVNKVWAAPGNDVFVAVKTYDPTGTLPESWVYRLSGETWTEILHLSDVTSCELFGTSPTDVYLGGYRCPGGIGSCGTGARALIMRFDGTTWSQASTPDVGTSCYRSIRGQRNDILASYYAGVLHYDGSNWSVSGTATGDVGFHALTYVRSNEAFSIWCWGYHYWNGSTWTMHQGFDFCDVQDVFGVRAGDGTLSLWATGNNNWANGIRAWRFSESPKGSGTGTFGASKYDTYINDQNGQGTATSIWASGPTDFWIVGSINNSREARIWHWDGSSWTRHLTDVTLGADIPYGVSPVVWGTSSSDVWVGFGDGQLLHYAD